MSKFFLHKENGSFCEVGSAISFGVTEKSIPVEDGGRNSGEKEFIYRCEANFNGRYITLDQFDSRDKANEFNCNLIRWICSAKEGNSSIHVDKIRSGDIS